MFNKSKLTLNLDTFAFILIIYCLLPTLTSKFLGIFQINYNFTRASFKTGGNERIILPFSRSIATNVTLPVKYT